MKTLLTYNRFGKEIGSIAFKESEIIGFVKYKELPGLMRLSVKGMPDSWVNINQFEEVMSEQQETTEQPSAETNPAESDDAL